ncbi:DNA cytosine methyltransferase [Bacillus cereus]|uniref:DNA cytosine methyltransferase n=1 Tax=Bacillus cereus TaxID=1396 RepID=UPI00187A9A0F|nr:DNA cytosine methyltransferase [Bacillus cereus]MBE7122358.1 DNA cytosine methyltransferase [Bacillus cereus]
MYAIDLFCGAGGFSEGIIQAGFHIVFSSDRSEHVMATYMNRHEQLGLIDGENTHFELADVRDLDGELIFNRIKSLPIFLNNPLNKGEIDAIFGGPPCQGFSRAGKKDPNDPRNMLFHEYVRIISEVEPRYVVMENVEGFMDTRLTDFRSLQEDVVYAGEHFVSDILQNELNLIGYNVLQPQILNAADYGVPQRRKRAIFIAYRNGENEPNYPVPTTPEEHQKVTVLQAIGDLIINGEDLEIDNTDYINASMIGRTPDTEGNPLRGNDNPLNHETSTHSTNIIERFSLFRQGESARNLESRIRAEGINLAEFPALLMECTFNANINTNREILRKLALEFELNINVESNLWLINISKLVANMFLAEDRDDMTELDRLMPKLKDRLKCTEDQAVDFYVQCRQRLNTNIAADELINRFVEGNVGSELMKSLLTKKNSRIKLDGNSISPTMLTLPDDFIHPYEDRILSVREMARLQSFDDSFEFLGKRTTGGTLRGQEVPQYTQVGNAVPPLLARAIASEIMNALNLN